MNKHKTSYLLEQINKLKKKSYEIAIIAPLLMEEQLSHVLPYTQFPVKAGGEQYYIDLYYPNLKLAIEIDEEFHEMQTEDDTKREINIKEILQCAFIRIKIDTDFDAYSKIKYLKEQIYNQVEQLKKDKIFVTWEPKIFRMEDAVRDYPNAVFYKIPENSVFGNPLLTGPLQISESKRRNADLFVSFSANTVVAVFERVENQVSWEQFDNQSNVYKFVGNELPNHALISSSGTANSWDVPSNRIYGENLDRLS